MTDEEIYLLVRADDIGSSQAANRACIDVFTQGICRSVEVMVPCPWFPEAARMLNEHPGYDVGVHLTLTSEWEGVKWGALTWAPSLTGPDGYFCPSFHRGSADSPAFGDLDWSLAEVKAELRAQIERCLRALPHASHLSFHMGGASVDPRIGVLYKTLADEYGLQVDLSDFRRFRGFGEGSQRLSAAQKTAALCANIARLTPGKWLFVEHPAYDTPESRAIGHAGYYGVARDRHGVTAAWTHPSDQAAIKERGIRLISYADVKAGRP